MDTFSAAFAFALAPSFASFAACFIWTGINACSVRANLVMLFADVCEMAYFTPGCTGFIFADAVIPVVPVFVTPVA